MNVKLYRMDASNSRAQWLKLCQFVREAGRNALIKPDTASLAWLPEETERESGAPKMRAGDVLNSVIILEDIVLEVSSLPLVFASARIGSGDTIQVLAKPRVIEVRLPKPIRLQPEDGHKSDQPNLQLDSLSFGPCWQRIVATEVKERRTFLFYADHGPIMRSHMEIPFEARSVSVCGSAQVHARARQSRQSAD